MISVQNPGLAPVSKETSTGDFRMASGTPERRVDAGKGLESVKALVMPTCNRVDFAVRSLRTFIENSLKFGLECEYVVYDDSLSPQVREAYRTGLKGLWRELGVPIFYAGLEEKISFSKQLLREKDLPAEIVKFALFDIYKHRASTLGANRNAVLLDNPGRAFVSVDDDTFCKMARLSGATDEVEVVPGDIYSASEPCEFVSFPDRTQLLAGLSYAEVPFLHIHDSVLGKRPPELGCRNTGQQSGGGKVLLSFNGLAGDCTWAPLNSYGYFFVTGPSLLRLTSSPEVYAAARSSREILRVSHKVYLTPNSASPGAFFGMDNRELLPPFMPLGGAEDNFYWEMKRKCFPADFFAHLPWALLHEPPPGRRFLPEDIRRPQQRFDFYSIVLAFLQSLPSMADLAVSDRITAIGKEFQRLGALPRHEFEFLVKDLLRTGVSRIKERVSRKLDENTEGCPLWREDVHHFLREFWPADHPDVAVPTDFMCFRDRDGAVDLAKTLIQQYGELLLAWPATVEKATALRLRGVRLARTVADTAKDKAFVA